MLNGPLSGTIRVSGYQKGKTNLDFTEQETVSGSDISWAICKCASRTRQVTTPAPHHSVLKADCPSCRPTNSVEALKANLKLLTVIVYCALDLITVFHEVRPFKKPMELQRAMQQCGSGLHQSSTSTKIMPFLRVMQKR